MVTTGNERLKQGKTKQTNFKLFKAMVFLQYILISIQSNGKKKVHCSCPPPLDCISDPSSPKGFYDSLFLNRSISTQLGDYLV